MSAKLLVDALIRHRGALKPVYESLAAWSREGAYMTSGRAMASTRCNYQESPQDELAFDTMTRP